MALLDQQDGQTATNPQTGEKVVLRGGQWVPVGQTAPQVPLQPAPQAPRPPDRIYGQPDPTAGLDAQYKQGQIAAQQRDNQEAPLRTQALEAQVTNAQRQQEEAAFTQTNALRDDYSKNPAVTNYLNVLPKYTAALKGANDRTPASDLALTYAYATMMDPASAVREGEQAMLSGGDTLFNQTVARLKKEMGQGGTFSDEYRRDILLQMRHAGAERRKAYDAARQSFEGIAQRAKVNPLDVIGPDQSIPYAEDERKFWYPEKPAAVAVPGAGTTSVPPSRPGAPNSDYEMVREDQIPETPARHFSPEQEAQVEKALRNGDFGLAYKLIDEFNGPGRPDAGSIRSSIEALRKNPRQRFAMDYSVADKRYEEQLRQSNEAVDKAMITGRGSDTGGLFAQGATSGLSDEIGGATGFVGALLTGQDPVNAYTFSRDASRLRNDDQRKRSGAVGKVAEVAGALATPLPFGKAMQGARGVELAMQGAKTGAIAGGLAGFGYGEGYQSVPNAMLGAGIGAPLGATVNVLAPKVGEVAKKIFAPSAKTVQRQAEMRAAGEAAQAAQAEGVPVSRAVLDPRSRNTVTALETTPGGNAPIREGLNATRQGIEQGVERLGQGGTARDAYEAGELVQAAGHRSIKWARERANKLYETAKRLGGNTPVAPQQALSAVEQNIAELKGLPKANDALIKYMEDLKSDMSRGLNVDTLRSLRTQMRGQISERNLTASDAERRVIGILDAASDDIAESLSGNPAAAAAYKRADAFFRQKQQYIKDVVQRFIGRRDAPMSAEQTWQKLEGMARGQDSRRMAEMMRSLSPDERLDVAATFAEQLGRNNAGDFTAAQLVSQAERLSDRAKLTIFGPEGARSLDNLLRVARELKATQGNLNNSRTGVAQNYRSWLANLVGIGGGGAVGQAAGGTPAALVGAYAGKVLADKGDELIQGWSARALMSPEITRWLASAPRTTNPAVIDGHVRRLAGIAASNPALAQEITVIQQRMVEAVRSLPERAAASGPNARDDERNRRKEVPQR